MINIHPDELFSQLQNNSSTRKKRTLELIHYICKNHSDTGNKDFSIVTIAGLISDAGGPSEQALRNKQAEDYRTLINLWAKYSNGTHKKVKRQKSTSVNDDILRNISDPTTKALVGMILAENKKLKNENSLLKQQTTLTIDMRKSKGEALEDNQNAVLLSPSHNITDMEIKALRDAISDKLMNHRGWTVDEYGRVKEKGITVYKTGYVSAIEKILEEVSK
jgi:hypothetical protein